MRRTRRGKGFFRAPMTPAVAVMASPAGKDVADMVRVRIADYLRHFESAEKRRFDMFHAQDAISGNALATLKQRGLIRRFARTVHHIDHFTDPRLGEWQTRSIAQADELFVVSALWQKQIASEFGRRLHRDRQRRRHHSFQPGIARHRSGGARQIRHHPWPHVCWPSAASRSARTVSEFSRPSGRC